MLQATAGLGGLPERPFMLCGQQSLHDPSRAPEGKHTAWAYTHGPQAVDWAAETDRHVGADGGPDASGSRPGSAT